MGVNNRGSTKVHRVPTTIHTEQRTCRKHNRVGARMSSSSQPITKTTTTRINSLENCALFPCLHYSWSNLFFKNTFLTRIALRTGGLNT